MTSRERIQQAQAALAHIPGGRLWIEEPLIRGSPEGAIKGAHVVYSYDAPDAFGGRTPPQMMAPFPLSISAEDEAWVLVAAALNAQAVDQVAALAAERDALADQVETLQRQLDAITPQTEDA